MRLKTNIVFEHLDESVKKIVAEQGGTRSGKTYNILMWIIFRYSILHTGETITIVRKTFPSVRATVMRDFFDILRKYDLYTEDNHSKSSNEYHLNGNLVEFISLDQPTKIRGRKRNLLFINEANELEYEDWRQLIFRTSGRVIIDYNPSDEYSWIYEKVITRKDCDFYVTTYRDNPFLEQTIIEEIERLKQTDETYWQIYGLGQRGTSKATIFQFQEGIVPEDAEFLSYGMDFGFNDPTTLVEVYRKDNDLYLNEILYRTGMTGYDMSQFLKQIDLKGYIYADSARPEIIEELRRMGLPIRKTKKGDSSIQAGIDILKRYRINVTNNSDNLIRELRNYKWAEDKSGRLTNIPVKGNDHAIDAARYGVFNILSKPNYGKYVIS
jgi:phage terminase large subunit